MSRVWNGGLPSRMASLPVDHRGFPVPFFVAWDKGEPVFPAMDPVKLAQCINHKRCWVCGGQLGKFMCFVIGPMCGVNRVSSEPPCHLDCAEFSVKNCPFLTQPRMRRIITQDGSKIDIPHNPPAGIMIERNPGVAMIWTTTSYRVDKQPRGVLLRIGEPHHVTFWAHGRRATRAEVDHSVETGLPALRKVAREHDGPFGEAALEQTIETFEGLLDELGWPTREAGHA
jgi:hypothetical protein